MIIDIEWGGFADNHEADYILTQYDRIVDSRAEHPNVNTLVFILIYSPGKRLLLFGKNSYIEINLVQIR